MTGDAPAKMIKPPTTIADKVTIGGHGAVDAKALKRAQQVIEDFADDYPDWAREDLAKMQIAFDDLKSADGASAESLDAVFQVAHDMKGQGGSFDYDLMTIIGNYLCRYIEGLKGQAGADDIDVIELHFNALKVVISQELKGMGGPVGDKLLTGLEMVVEKRAKVK